MSDEINCTDCGRTTNHVPSPFPQEWEGYCPTCAVGKMMAGELPRCDLNAFMSLVMGKLEKALGVDIEALLTMLSSDTMAIGDDGESVAFIHRQCLN